jgi:hypothetical protein
MSIKPPTGGYGQPTAKGKKYLHGFNPGSRDNSLQILTGSGGSASAPGMGSGGFGSPGMGGMPGGFGGGIGGGSQSQAMGRTSGSEGYYSGDAGARGAGGNMPMPGGGGGNTGGGMGQGEGSIPSMGGAGQSAGGFGQATGNQGSTGFGGAGQSDFTPTLGGGMGGGGTTPNRPPTVNQPPMMNSPTGGPPKGFGSPGVSYPSPGADAARQKTRQSNSGGVDMGYGGGMPGSPQTPSIMHPNQPGNYNTSQPSNKPQIPWGGNTYTNNRNIYGGNTNTYSMTQQGDQINQGQSMKRLANKKRAMAATAPQQRKTIGSTVQNNLNAMSGGMRYM